jgi:hypothetical protein
VGPDKFDTHYINLTKLDLKMFVEGYGLNESAVKFMLERFNNKRDCIKYLTAYKD